ncbi:unnamed protein product [Effrenium voratum]|uniref:Uncharacterized protein n=1 Tax=Effrenium voratum TaxID=2562239 RepID=A0AA36HQZ3_9DINO|nr:unnamed protein product [Effrenium voratum]CAJ1451931.1 unnamed protein product [Effrenium voratum]
MYAGLPHCLRYCAGHNDLRLVAKKEYYREVRGLCERVLTGNPEAFQPPDGNPGWLAALGEVFSGSALKCLPGIRRCFVNSSDDIQAETPH